MIPDAWKYAAIAINASTMPGKNLLASASNAMRARAF
jgi:hypothetical protein